MKINCIRRNKTTRRKAAFERSVESNRTPVMVVATIHQRPRRHQPCLVRTPTTAIIITAMRIINDLRYMPRQRPSDLKRTTTRIRTRKDITYCRPHIDLAQHTRIHITTMNHPARLPEQLRTTPTTRTSTTSTTQTTINRMLVIPVNRILAVPFKPQL